MPHMLAEEYMGYVVIDPALPRTHTTIQNALSNIGGATVTLVLTKSGDGIWAINAPLVFPANITPFIPSGVFVTGSGNITFGVIPIPSSGWYAGTGTLTYPPSAPASYFNHIICTALGVNTIPRSMMHLSGDSGAHASIFVEQRTLGAGNAGIEFYGPTSTLRGVFGLLDTDVNSDIYLALASGSDFLVYGGRMGVNAIPAAAPLHVISTEATSVPAVRIDAPPLATGLEFRPVTTPQVSITLATHTSAGNTVPAIVLQRDPAVGSNNWEIGNNLTFMLCFGHPGQSPHLAVTNGGTWIGDGTVVPTPTHLLQLQANDAYMPGGGPFGNSTSDERLKENVALFTDGLAVAMQLIAKWYEYNGLGGTVQDGKRYVGFIAQDVETIVPYMVGHDTTRKLIATDETTTDFFTMSEGSLPYILLNAIKEQQAQIQALTDRVAALEAALP